MGTLTNANMTQSEMWADYSGRCQNLLL